MADASFLSDTQKEKLAKILDQRFNLPLIKGQREYRVWVKFVTTVDSIIAARVQDEYLDAMNDRDFQIEELFINALQENLSPLLADLIMVPIIPGTMKRKLIDLLLEIILKALAEATTLDETIEDFLRDA